MSRDIFLNIDTIVLHGINHIDRHALTEALQQTLHEQLSSSQKLRTTESTRVRTSITLPATFGAEQLGHALGQNLNGIISNSEPAANLTQQSRHRGKRNA